MEKHCDTKQIKELVKHKAYLQAWVGDRLEEVVKKVKTKQEFVTLCKSLAE